ncbi:MAG: DUF2892 domain-containing protein [Gammaproteobacteria bacterium]|nr:DUF2892 domain-containing protein [Gammaproteobacteria bacterium]
MIYVKNLPAWERLMRLAAGVAVGVAGLRVGGGFYKEAGLFLLGGGLALTAVLGFCPACVLAGRRLKRRAEPPSPTTGR